MASEEERIVLVVMCACGCQAVKFGQGRQILRQADHQGAERNVGLLPLDRRGLALGGAEVRRPGLQRKAQKNRQQAFH